MEEITLNPLELWSHALGWTLIGITFVKLLVLDKSVILNKEFDWVYYLKNNILDVLRGLTLTLITIKLGEVVFSLLGTFGIDFNGVTSAIQDAGLDPVQISLVVAIAFQWWLYKRYLKKEEATKQ
jgi:hypothetical protein